MVATMQARITIMSVNARTYSSCNRLNFEATQTRHRQSPDSLDEGQILQTAVQELAQGLQLTAIRL